MGSILTRLWGNQTVGQVTAVPDRPVVLDAWDYHTVWANSAAIERAGLDRGIPALKCGKVPLRADGRPLGTFQEWDAIDLIRSRIPAVTPSEMANRIDYAAQVYARAGVTWIQDAWVDEDTLEGYFLWAGRDPRCRINLAFRADPRQWHSQLDRFALHRACVNDLKSPFLTARTVKFFIDGIIENRTAMMLDSYCDADDAYGLPVWDREELFEALAAFDRLGFQVHLHAIGDAANRTALDGIEYVIGENGVRDRRPVIAHAHVIHPRDLPRFAELGVIANFQPYWAQIDRSMTDFVIPGLGPERAEWQLLIGRMMQSGAVVSFGSDWPVTDEHPIEGLATAVNRRSGADAPTLLPEERIHPATHCLHTPQPSPTRPFTSRTAALSASAWMQTSSGFPPTRVIRHPPNSQKFRCVAPGSSDAARIRTHREPLGNKI